MQLSCLFYCTQELEFQQKKKERIQGDTFVESMGSFAKVSLFSMSELDDSWKEMKAKVKVTHTQSRHSLTWTDTQPDSHSQEAALVDCLLVVHLFS